MKIKIIAVGTKMPAWVNEGYSEYLKRLPKEISVQMLELPLANRSKNAKNTSVEKLKELEGDAILAAIPDRFMVIALDVLGAPISTEKLSNHIDNWKMNGENITILIGGPNGLAEKCLRRAHQKWSLSKLTLPHPVVRIVLIEQLYRAWTILAGHPYHK